MSNCEVKLTFDRPNLTYCFGEQVSGIVEVRVDSECRCRKLVLEREWRTHGKGDRDSSKEEPMTLFEGTWQPGPVCRYPFRFTAPNGPETYHGYELNVDWYVRARADLPWALDPKDELEILLVAPRSSDSELPTRMYNFGRKYKEPDPIDDKVQPGTIQLFIAPLVLAYGLWIIWSYVRLHWPMSVRDWGTIGGLVLFLAPIIMFRFFFTDRKASKQTMPTTLLGDSAPVFGALVVSGLLNLPLELAGGVAVAAIGLYGTCWALYLRMIGCLQIEIWPVVVRRDHTIAWEIRLPTSAEHVLTKADATLSAKEIATKCAGTRTSTSSHLVYENEVPLMRRVDLIRDVLILEGCYAIPEDAPVSFSSGSNELKWEAGIGVAVKGLPAWRHSYPIVVRP